MELLDNLYWYEHIGQGNNCNTVAIVSKSCLLVDPGHSWNFEKLLQEMKEDGIYAEDINIALNTHCHPDHCESNEKLTKISRVKIVMHEIEADYLKNKAKSLYEMFSLSIPDFKIDSYLEDSLKLNGIDLEIIHTPGHSPGSVCIYLRKKKVLICGDLVFENSFGRTDLPGGNPLLIKESIERISKLSIEYLLPGHGRMVKGEKNVINNFNYILRILEYNAA